MSALTVAEARDIICGVIKAAWDAYTPPGSATKPPLHWDNVDSSGVASAPNPPDPGVGYIRFGVRFTGGGQASLGVAPDRKFRRMGVFAAEIRTPVKAGPALADSVTQMVLNAFEDNASGVWFRNVRPSSGGRVGGFWEQGVVGEFQFDDHR